MKKVIILFIIIGTTKVFSQDVDIPIVKNIIKFGVKGGLNFNAPSDITLTSSQFSNIEDAKDQVSGFYVGFYSLMYLTNLLITKRLSSKNI